MLKENKADKTSYVSLIHETRVEAVCEVAVTYSGFGSPSLQIDMANIFLAVPRSADLTYLVIAPNGGPNPLLFTENGASPLLKTVLRSVRSDLKKARAKDTRYTISLSCAYIIQRGAIVDLLNPANADFVLTRDNRGLVYFENLSDVTCADDSELDALMGTILRERANCIATEEANGGSSPGNIRLTLSIRTFRLRNPKGDEPSMEWVETDIRGVSFYLLSLHDIIGIIGKKSKLEAFIQPEIERPYTSALFALPEYADTESLLLSFDLMADMISRGSSSWRVPGKSIFPPFSNDAVNRSASTKSGGSPAALAISRAASTYAARSSRSYFTFEQGVEAGADTPESCGATISLVPATNAAAPSLGGSISIEDLVSHKPGRSVTRKQSASEEPKVSASAKAAPYSSRTDARTEPRAEVRTGSRIDQHSGPRPDPRTKPHPTIKAELRHSAGLPTTIAATVAAPVDRKVAKSLVASFFEKKASKQTADQGSDDHMNTTARMQLEIKRLTRELEESRLEKIVAESGKNDLIEENRVLKAELASLKTNLKYKTFAIKKGERQLAKLSQRMSSGRPMASSCVEGVSDSFSTSALNTHTIDASGCQMSTSPVVDIPPEHLRRSPESARTNMRDTDSGDSTAPLPALDGRSSSIADILAATQISPRKEVSDGSGKRLTPVLEAALVKRFDSMARDIASLQDANSRLTDELLAMRDNYRMDASARQTTLDKATEELQARLRSLADENEDYHTQILELEKAMGAADERLSFYEQRQNRESLLVETVSQLRNQLHQATKKLLEYEANETK